MVGAIKMRYSEVDLQCNDSHDSIYNKEKRDGSFREIFPHTKEIILIASRKLCKIRGHVSVYEEKRSKSVDMFPYTSNFWTCFLIRARRKNINHIAPRHVESVVLLSRT